MDIQQINQLSGSTLKRLSRVAEVDATLTLEKLFPLQAVKAEVINLYREIQVAMVKMRERGRAGKVQYSH